jgi:hypothetical protein
MRRLTEEERSALVSRRAGEQRRKSASKQQAYERVTKAETRLGEQKRAEHQALLASRHARKARLLSEQELRTAQFRPYTEAAKGVVRGVVQVARIPWQGLKWLEAHQQPARPKPVVTRSQATHKQPSKLLDLGIHIDKIELL